MAIPMLTNPTDAAGSGQSGSPGENNGKRASASVVRAVLIGICFVAVAFTAAIVLGGSTSISGSATASRAAVAEYSAHDLRAIALKYFEADGVEGDAGSLSMVFTEYAATGTWESLKSYLGDLGFSGATYDRMMVTRALDGTLEADGHNCNVTWTYHPDHGLRLIFENAPRN